MKRLIQLTESLAAQPHASISGALASWAETKATYRPLSNDHVDAIEILTCHTSKSEMQAHPVMGSGLNPLKIIYFTKQIVISIDVEISNI